MDLKKYISQRRGMASELAAKLDGVSPSYLSQMATGKAAISTKRAVEIERVTNGQVTRQELCHDDWHERWPELAQKRRKTDKNT